MSNETAAEAEAAERETIKLYKLTATVAGNRRAFFYLGERNRNLRSMVKAFDWMNSELNRLFGVDIVAYSVEESDVPKARLEHIDSEYGYMIEEANQP